MTDTPEEGDRVRVTIEGTVAQVAEGIGGASETVVIENDATLTPLRVQRPYNADFDRVVGGDDE